MSNVTESTRPGIREACVSDGGFIHCPDCMPWKWLELVPGYGQLRFGMCGFCHERFRLPQGTSWVAIKISESRRAAADFSSTAGG